MLIGRLECRSEWSVGVDRECGWSVDQSGVSVLIGWPECGWSVDQSGVSVLIGWLECRSEWSVGVDRVAGVSIRVECRC